MKTQVYHLTGEEVRLIKTFRETSPENRRILLRFAETCRSESPSRPVAMLRPIAALVLTLALLTYIEL